MCRYEKLGHPEANIKTEVGMQHGFFLESNTCDRKEGKQDWVREKSNCHVDWAKTWPAQERALESVLPISV